MIGFGGIKLVFFFFKKKKISLVIEITFGAIVLGEGPLEAETTGALRDKWKKTSTVFGAC